MTTETLIDQAHAIMEANPEDDTARLRFYERLADAELFVLLSEEANGDVISPEVIEVDEQSFVLVFDTEERLAQFTGAVTPYIGVSGRVIVSMLVGQDLGLGVNLGVASSETLLPSDAVEWLAQTLSAAPDEMEAQPESFAPPVGLPEKVLKALDAKLVSAAGLVAQVWLVGVTYVGGAKGHLLAFIDAQDGAERALAKAAHEALTFSGVEAGSIDVAFFASDEGAVAAIRRQGLQFELPSVLEAEAWQPKAPGMDPKNPPKLK